MPVLAEGEVARSAASDPVSFTAVTSCVTVLITVTNTGDTFQVGGHISLMQASGGLDSTQVIPAMANLFQNDDEITAVQILGEGAVWSASYLTDRPLVDAGGTYQYTEQEVGQLSTGIGEVAGVVYANISHVPGGDDLNLYSY